MKRLGLLALLLLVACQGPHYHRYPVETVDSLRAQLDRSGPATLKVYDSAGTKWLQVQPVEPLDGKAIRATPFEPLDKSWECPPICP